MKLSLLVIGKTKQPFVREGLLHYAERLRHYAPFEIVELPEAAVRGATPPRDDEARRLVEKLPRGAFVVALDEHGKAFSSAALARLIEERRNAATQAMAFLVGGPYGHGEAVRRRADLTLSLSLMTFPHDLVRLLFAEQLYRAHTILRGEPYHHE